MVAAPIFGYLGDRFNRKVILSCGIFFWSAVTLLSSFITKDVRVLYYLFKSNPVVVNQHTTIYLLSSLLKYFAGFHPASDLSVNTSCYVFFFTAVYYSPLGHMFNLYLSWQPLNVIRPATWGDHTRIKSSF